MFQSTELTGGAGFTFEDAAVAVYLAALLGEETAPGLPGRVVVRVASQQAAFGHPLDDLVVEGRSSDDVPARLSLQVAPRRSPARADLRGRDRGRARLLGPRPRAGVGGPPSRPAALLRREAGREDKRLRLRSREPPGARGASRRRGPP